MKLGLLILLLNLWGLKTFAQPSFKGGQEALNHFIAGNLIYPEFSKSNCLQGTIRVSFKLNKKGRIFDSHVEKGMGIDLDDEALRIVRLTSGKWNVPAGYDTSVAIIIPINFSLSNYHCENTSAESIRNAIAAYKARQDLTNAVVNYYKNKSDNQSQPESEQYIESLKQQLGYDDKFIAQMIKRGQQKLKQGDHDGACEDFNFVHNIGSDKADKLIEANCR